MCAAVQSEIAEHASHQTCQPRTNWPPIRVQERFRSLPAARERQALFAFALYPATLECAHSPIGREGINELGKICSRVVDIDEDIHWQERSSASDTQHPQHALLSRTLTQLKGKRRERATQLFHYLLVNDIAIETPDAFEREFNQCIYAIRAWRRKHSAR